MDPTESAPTPKPYPGLAQSPLVVLLFFLFMTLFTLPAAILTTLKRPHWAAWLLLLGQLGGAFFTLTVCLSLGGGSWARILRHRPVRPAVWPLTLVVTAGLILILNGLDGWLTHLIPPPALFRQVFVDMGWPGVVLGAPLTEEPIFRGLILGGFALRYGARRGILYSALLFGLIHLNPWQLPTGILMGLFLGWLTLHTGSLWPAVVSHFLNNLSVTLAHANRVPYLADERFQPIWMWLLGLLLVGLGLAGLRRLIPNAPIGDDPQTGRT